MYTWGAGVVTQISQPKQGEVNKGVSLRGTKRALNITLSYYAMQNLKVLSFPFTLSLFWSFEKHVSVWTNKYVQQ